jgi:putative ABC transport system permease protein
MLLLKALRGRRLRTVLAVVGIGVIAQLVLVLFAVYRAPVASVRGYVGQGGVDLWMAPAGTDNLMRASGVLPIGVLDEVRKVPGVTGADALLRIFVSATLPEGQKGPAGARLTLMGFGYRAPDGLGGPPVLASGRAPAASDEVALDRAAAHRLAVGVGDGVLVNGRPSTVVGLTSGTNLLATQFLFFDLGAAQRTSGLARQASFVVVKLDANSDREAVRRAIAERFPEAAVVERSAFVANSIREAVAGILPVLALVALLGVAVAAVLVALIEHGIVEDRRTDIAVLLLLGSSPSRVAAGLVVHAVLLVLAGGMVGAGLALGLSSLLDRTLPTIELAFSAGDLAMTLGVFTAAGVLGASMPVARLRRIDPLETFRS